MTSHTERSPTRPSDAGYSLIEMLVVLAIVALLVGVAPAAYNTARPGLQARAAAMETASQLRRTRAWAMSHAEDAVVRIDIAARRIEAPVPDGTLALPDGVGVFAYVADSEREGESIGGVRFFHDGGSTGGRLKFTARDTAYQIDVDWLLGRITVSRVAADAREG